jgi:hypothetical protein
MQFLHFPRTFSLLVQRLLPEPDESENSRIHVCSHYPCACFGYLSMKLAWNSEGLLVYLGHKHIHSCVQVPGELQDKAGQTHADAVYALPVDTKQKHWVLGTVRLKNADKNV